MGRSGSAAMVFYEKCSGAKGACTRKAPVQQGAVQRFAATRSDRSAGSSTTAALLFRRAWFTSAAGGVLRHERVVAGTCRQRSAVYC